MGGASAAGMWEMGFGGGGFGGMGSQLAEGFGSFGFLPFSAVTERRRVTTTTSSQ
jgi:hypothetical protein